MVKTRDMLEGSCRTLRERESMTIGQGNDDGCWAISASGCDWQWGASAAPQNVVVDDRLAANPINYTDATGLWKIERKGGPLAEAIMEEGDTIQGLADKIGMDPDEWEKWLTVKENGSFHLSVIGHFTVNTGLYSGGCSDKFFVPNTILSLWLGELGDIGKLSVDWGGDNNWLRSKGYNVVEHGATGFPPAALYKFFHDSSSSAAKELYGFFYTGHGGPDEISDNRGYSASYKDMSDALSYRLGFELLNACEGGWSSTDTNVPVWHQETVKVWSNTSDSGKDPSKTRWSTVTKWVLSPVPGVGISAGGADLHAPGAFFWGMKGTLVPQIGPLLPMNTHHPREVLPN
jgi:hypothetical protein